MNKEIKKLIEEAMTGDLDVVVDNMNDIREFIHSLSPFKTEPVEMVYWVKNDKVKANDYNPNSVAPPEMKLLERSIEADGYTQPIVSYHHDDIVEVVDGFHRHRVGKESEVISERVKGFLPVVKIKESQQGQNDRMASTIRHNRARGKHGVTHMSDIVIDLKKRNWSDKKISKELGMDEDEILRLSQISGMSDVFGDYEFSMSWDVNGFEDGLCEDLEDGENLPSVE